MKQKRSCWLIREHLLVDSKSKVQTEENYRHSSFVAHWKIPNSTVIVESYEGLESESDMKTKTNYTIVRKAANLFPTMLSSVLELQNTLAVKTNFTAIERPMSHTPLLRSR